MSDPTNEPREDPPAENRATRARLTPLRLAVWILGGGFAIYLIITGVVGILTKAR
jgi:hypothetical protein